MRKAIDSAKRTTDERKHLTCHACGAGNSLAPGVLERGFQRCDRCGTAMPVEGAGSYAFDSAGLTHVISPGRSSLVLRYGRLFPVVGWLVFLLVGEMAGALIRHILKFPLGLEQVAWVPVACHVSLAVLFFLMICVEQRILLLNNRVEASYRLFGVQIFRRRFGTFGLELHVREKWPCGLLLRPRAGLPMWIGTEDAQEAATLKNEVAIAVEETRQRVGERLRCPGCGAPVATALEIVARKGAECEHCDSGLVAVKGGVVLGACRVESTMGATARRSASRRSPHRGTVEWKVGSELSRNPSRAIGIWSIGLLLGGMALLAGVGITLLAEGLRSFGVIFAMFFVPLGLGLLYFFTVSFFGRHRIALDATVLEHDLYLGPFRLNRKRIPLARLLSFEAKHGGTTADLAIKTPMTEVSIALPDAADEGAAVAAEVADAIRDNLRALEREVEWISAATPGEAQPELPRPGGG